MVMRKKDMAKSLARDPQEQLRRYSILPTGRRLSHFRKSSDEAGKLLKRSLDKHFGALDTRYSRFAPDLDGYVREVFHQLDYHHCGTISKEDFETLCEVLGISASPPPSYRNSGLEWLTSYRPRPNSPLSPLKLDRLGEVKYNRQNNNGVKKPFEPPANFLFTIGPRPFWEMWPQKKRKKKRLTIDEFKKCLLEQWAKSRGISASKVSTIPPVFPICHFERGKMNDADRIDTVPPTQMEKTRPKKSVNIDAPHSKSCQTHIGRISDATASSRADSPRKRRLMRSIIRVTRKYQMLEKINRRMQREYEAEDDVADG